MAPEGSRLPPDAGRPASNESEPPLDRALLEKVLLETLSASHQSTPEGGATLVALREVARRHRGQPLAVEPMAVEMIRAILRVSFPKAPVDSRSWQTMATRIAQTLLDDPVARERLKAFWAKLTETKP